MSKEIEIFRCVTVPLESKFGRLTVKECKGKNIRGSILYECVCECGKRSVVRAYSLINGDVRSCGCYRKEQSTKSLTTHGMCRTPEYLAWKNMNRRCGEKHRNHSAYFDRGISVAEQWKTPNGFPNFFSHVGKRPGLLYSLDRINNDKGYEPGNVRWATKLEQVKNRRKSNAIQNFSNEELLEEVKRRNL